MRFVHPATLLEKVRKVCDPSQQGDPSSASAPTTSGTRSDPDPDDPTSTQPVDQTSGTAKTGSSQTSMLKFLPKGMTPLRQNMIDEELAKMIAKDFQPFSVVEDKGFKNYCLALNPSYVLPARKTLSQKIIPKLYDRQRESLQAELSKASAVCITSDSWTSRATSSFMAVTCHYIEDYKMK
ncbi:hypothetical protein Pcinc_007344 [Petrolisthes cinctipes]|uniref:Uncharacterized protein n=1 Tax=Petrolisthes cinctipes TaxID=88211 RepID=A0AAE1GBB3_PETCI|nr:hypothetical protein Pcinc_007344 [Petrolisthes cinctipes]